MSDSIFQGAVIAPEDSYGAFAKPDTRLAGAGLSYGIDASKQTFTPKGYKFATVMGLGKEFTKISLEGAAAINDLPFLLSSVMRKMSPTGSTEKTWTANMNSTGPDDPQSFTGLFGDGATRQALATGIVLDELGFEFSKDSVQISGGGFAQRIKEGVSVVVLSMSGPPTAGTFTLTYNEHETAGIAYDAEASAIAAALAALADFSADDVECYGGPLPSSAVVIVFKNNDVIAASEITVDSTGLTGGTGSAADLTITAMSDVAAQGTDVSVYLADTAAGLDAAEALTNALSGSWKLSGRWGKFWPLKAGESFSDITNLAPSLNGSLKMAVDGESMGMLSTMRTGATKFIRFEVVTSTQISGSSEYYGFTVDMAFKVPTPQDFSDEDGLYALEWQFDAVHDATWGKATEIVVTGDLAAL